MGRSEVNQAGKGQRLPRIAPAGSLTPIIEKKLTKSEAPPNKKRRRNVVLVFGQVFFLFVFIIAMSFPPWEYTFTRPGMAVVARPAGNHLLLSPPSVDKPEDRGRGVRVSVNRYVAQVGLSGFLLFISCIPLLRRKR